MQGAHNLSCINVRLRVLMASPRNRPVCWSKQLQNHNETSPSGGHQTCKWIKYEKMHLSLISIDIVFGRAGELCSRLVESNQPANGRSDASLQYKTWMMLQFNLTHLPLGMVIVSGITNVYRASIEGYPYTELFDVLIWWLHTPV